MKHKNYQLTGLIAVYLFNWNASYAEHHGNSNDYNHARNANMHNFGTHKDEHSCHDHDSHKEHNHSKAKAGPNGGRLISTIEPHFEFFLTKERFVQITFLDEKNQAIPFKQQTVSLIGGDRQNPVRLRFKKKGGILISTEALPEINNLPIILSVKPDKASKTVREKFYLNLSQCPTCDYKEYACVCLHGKEKHGKHDD